MDMFSADTLKAWSVDTLAAKSAQLLMAKRLRWSSSLAIQLWPLAPMGCNSLKHGLSGRNLSRIYILCASFCKQVVYLALNSFLFK